MYHPLFTGFYQFLSPFYLFLENGENLKTISKTSISVDIVRQIITGFKIFQQTVHDIPRAEKLLVQCRKMRKSDTDIHNKVYDSEDIYRLIRDDLNAYSLIPARIRIRKRIFGVYLKELAKPFDQSCYY